MDKTSLLSPSRIPCNLPGRVGGVTNPTAFTFTDDAEFLPRSLSNIFRDPWMSLRTLSFKFSVEPASVVLGYSHRFQMTRSHTAMNSTGVIPDEARGRLTSQEMVGRQVTPLYRKSSVSISIDTGRPKPTGVSLTDFGPKSLLRSSHGHIVSERVLI